MKIVLVCPSNILYMPYVDNYTKVLNELDVDYDIINWDRFGIEEQSEFIYRDSNIGHQRGFLDYLRYSKFVLKLLKRNNYDKIIVFGIQLTFFIKRYLTDKYSERFMVDIRDHNKVIKCFNIKNVIDKSAFTVISSPGYKEWLPESDKYIINHNTTIQDLSELRKVKNDYVEDNKISLGFVGALRDYQINIDLINSLKNNELVQLNYHGEGEINETISQYLVDNNIRNVSLTGRYAKEDEERLYYKNSIINVLRYNDGINNKTALPNRLYNAVIYGKPMLAFEGTQLSEIITNYNLGIVITSFKSLEVEVAQYLKGYDVSRYNENRNTFFKYVIEDNNSFTKSLNEFIHI